MLVASGVELGDASTAALGRLPHVIGNVIGSIQTAIGRCTITRAGSGPIQAIAGDPVCPDDVIETAADGRIEIRFIDGTVFNLSHDSGVVLGEFPRDAGGTLRSALLSVIRGAFAFTAGELAKSGSLTVDTAVGSIRGRTQASGFGLLSLAALTFALVKEAHAADPNVTFLDDDALTYKDLSHGVFELVTKEAIPRHIVVEDPGETVVLSRRGSSVGINTVTNTPAQMQDLQGAQQDALANYAKGWSPVGSGASPFANPGDLLQPINFIQPDPNYQQNQLPPLQTAVFQQVVLSPPTLAITSIGGGQISVAEDDIINASKAAAGVDIVGATSGVQNGQIVTVSITNGSDQVVFSGTATVSNGAWSLDLSPAQAKALADGMYTLTAEVTNASGQTAEASQPIRVDVTPPSIAIDTIARSNVVNADIAGAGFVIAGTVSDAENGQPVTVRIVDSAGDVVDIFVTTLANDSWSVNVTSAEAQALHDGSYTVTADVSDTAGNPAPEAAQALTIDETRPALSWLPQAETGIEGTAIALGVIAATASSVPGHANSVQSLVVSGIPVGAELTDGTNSFMATSGNTAIDVKGWNLSTLKIIPPNDTNFTLTVTATDQDANTSVASELVTVSPLAPILDPVAAHGNENTAIALDLGAMARSLSGANGDAAPNSLAALVVSDIPVGATLSDGTGLPGHSFTATAGNTAEDIAGWNLSSLTIAPPAEFEGSFTLQIAATERDSEGDVSTTVTASELVTVAPVAEPPTASSPPTLVLNENTIAAAVAGVRVGPLAEDSDDTVSATLTVSHGTLHVAGASGVTVSGDGSATLTLSGSAAAVNALLAGLTYTPTSEYEGSDTLHLSVTSTDGSNTYPTAATASTAITVNPVAEPPTANAPPTLVLNENAVDVAIAGMRVGPLAEDSDDTVSATLTVAHGTLHVAGLSGVTVAGDGSATLTLSGSAAAVNALLAGLTYTPTSEYEGSDTILLSVTSIDGSNTYPTPATASTAITVNPVAEPPTACAPPTLVLCENATGVAIAGVRVGPLAEDADDTVSATLIVSHGTLHVAGLSGVTVTGDDSAALTLSGNAAAVNALLAGLTYTPTTEYEGSDTLRMSVTSSDGSNTYPSTATASTRITVNPVAEPPTASAPSTATTAKDTAIDIGGVVVGPPAEDADDTVSVLLTIAHGTLTVNAVAGVTETPVDDGSLRLSGTASEVNAALASLLYTPDDDFIGNDTLEVSVTSIDGSNTYPTPAIAETVISVTLCSESLIVGGPGPMIEWNNADNWSGGVVPTLGINTTIHAPANYTAVVDGFSQAKSVTIPHGAASTDITATGTLQLAGDLNIIESGKFENDGILEETTSASFIGPITNNGTIIVDPGIVLDASGTISGTGKFWIDSGATLEFDTGSKVAPGTTDSQVVYFEQGAGKLIIDDWGKFAGVITGTAIGAQLTSSDLIDLTQLPFVGGSMSVAVSYDAGTNVSTMIFSDGSAANNVTLHLSGNYTGTNWTFTSINGGAGTEVSDPPAGSGGIAADASDTGWMRSIAQNITAQIVGSASSGTVPMMAAGVWASAPGSSSALDTGDTLASMIIAGLGADLLVGGNGSNTFVYSHAVNSNAAPSDTITDFVPGADKIDLTAFGSLAPTILTLAPTSTSVPAHTIAWLYDSKANQAVVYVNPTDHAVGIGDSSLVAIHLPGVANVHLSDFVLATTTVAAANDPVDLTTAPQSDVTSIAFDASDIKAGSGALLIDQSSSAPATGVHHSSDAIKDSFDTTDDAKFVVTVGGTTPSTGDGVDDATTALASGLSAVPPHLAMPAPTQASFVFDQNPVSDSGNATPVTHGAAPESSDAIVPSGSDVKDNSDANANNGDHGASSQKVASLTNAGDAHGNQTDISENAASDTDDPKTPANDNGKGSSASDTGDNTAPAHGANPHDDGASPPGQSKSEDFFDTSGQAFNFKEDMPTPDGSAVNDAPDDVSVSKGHHGHGAPTQETQAGLEGGAAFGGSGDSFSFKQGNSNSKGSDGTGFAGLDQNSAPANNQKGIDVSPGATQTTGLSPHDHSDDHLNHGAHALMVHASHDLIM